MTVYDAVKTLCDKKGLAMTALEKELGFGRGSIGKLKHGGHTTGERLRKIADYFGISVENLLSGNVQAYDPGLQFIIETWPKLSDRDRAEILRMVEMKFEWTKSEKNSVSG